MYKFLLAMLALLVIFSGCQKGQDSTDEISLVVWVTYKEEEMRQFTQIIENFSQEYFAKHQKKVKIIPKQVPFDDLVTNLKMACLSQKTPDIARVDVQKILEMAYHQALVELDKLPNFDASSIDEKAKSYMSGPFNVNVVNTLNTDTNKFERHLYGLPEQTSCLALFWNKKMFRALGNELRAANLDPDRAPRTWDELIAYSKILTRDQNYGFAMSNTLWWSLPFFYLYKANIVVEDPVTKNKVCTLGDERTTAAFQLKVDLYQKHKIEAGAWKSGAIGPDVGFINEKYAMIFMGPWFVEKFIEKGLDFSVALIPGISEEEAKRLNITDAPKSATNVGGNSMVMFKTCKHQEIGYDFINYMASWEVQLKLARELKQIPVHKKATDILLGNIKEKGYENITVDPMIRTFIDQIQYAVAPAPLPRYEYIETDVVNPEMELALKNEKSVQKALKDAAEKINKNVLSLVNE